tara:strand:+ start:3202 stop:4773 length:1572 start_codon:yes stop_codon:yes gene_type:complete
MRKTRTRTKLHEAKIPFPDIVSGEGGWKIFEDAERPRTSNMSKEMYVPFGDKCPLPLCESYHAKQIRRHELAHVKWSPKTIGKLTEDESEIAVEVVEEARIGYLLAQRQMSIKDWVMCEKKIREKHDELIHTASEFDLICYLLAIMWNSTNGYPIDDDGVVLKTHHRNNFVPNNLEYTAFQDVYEELKAKDNGRYLTRLRIMQIDFVLNRATYFYNRLIMKRRNSYWTDNTYKPTYRKTRQVAKELNLLRDSFDELPEEHEVLEEARQKHLAKQNAGKQAANMQSIEGDGEGEDGSGLTLAEREQKTKQEVTTERSYGTMNYNPKTDYSGQWGNMDIIQAPLEINMQSQLNKGREYRPMEYGTNPKYINRWCVDKKIFKQKQRTYGGTILIDASGSMHFDGEDILEIMQLLPAATIAMYNDRGQGYDTGSLRIIGAGGKRVTTEYLRKFSGGGNLVDGPALDWLGTQKASRIWVSDMYVFGKGNSNSYNLLQDCYQKMKRNGITRLANIDEVKRFALEINQLQ